MRRHSIRDGQNDPLGTFQANTPGFMSLTILLLQSANFEKLERSRCQYKAVNLSGL